MPDRPSNPSQDALQRITQEQNFPGSATAPTAPYAARGSQTTEAYLEQASVS